jgi:hypothetical protein
MSAWASRWARRRRVSWTIALGAVGVVASGGCATYSDKLAEARTRADQGQYASAVDELNDFLDVESAEEIPPKWKGDGPLAVLERGVLLQAEGDYALSARDLAEADEALELLDLKTDTVGQIGKYVYSDTSATYAASPTERTSLNALNVANFLALGDLSSAAVEARRFANMQEYLDSIDLQGNGTVGAYLSGFTFERLGEGDRALRFYEEALAGRRLDTLSAPVARLAAANPYRGPNLEAMLAEHGTAAPTPPRAEILTVVALGRVPYKVPKRLPIGAAIGVAGTFVTGNTAILERSVLKVVVYPELERSGTRARDATVRIDGQPAPVELVANLGNDIAKEYEMIKPRIIGAALTRLISRAIAAEGARAAGRAVNPIVGLLTALAAEGTLVALDKPDTRSWTFLPERVAISRVGVEPGAHRVEIAIAGVAETRSVPVQVDDGGFAVVVVTVPR